MLWAQVTLVVLLIIGFFDNVYRDFNGYQRKPLGYSGFVGSCIVLLLNFLLAYYAGALSQLIR